MVNNGMTLRRYENTLARDVVAIIDAAIPEIEALIYRLDPNAVLPGNRQRRIQALQRAFDRIVDPMYVEMAALTRDELVSVAQLQEAFATSTLQTAIGPTVSLGKREFGKQFWRSVIAEDPIQGAVMRDWWITQNAKTKRGFRRAVQLGLTEGDTTPEIVRRVRGLAVGRGVYRGGVMSASTREATALVRTAVNQISNAALNQTWQQYDDVTQEYEWVSTLDSRTTPICATRDGQTWPYGEGPLPPAHWNCRSTTVPVVNWEAAGLTPPPEGERASAEGPVKASTKYEQWLRDQDKATQDKFFGSPKRADLFRSGEKTLGQLVASDGQFRTLEQLGAT
jgi:SPP1 gp7 family putative phage head morphogenesis protein